MAIKALTGFENLKTGLIDSSNLGGTFMSISGAPEIASAQNAGVGTRSLYTPNSAGSVCNVSFTASQFGMTGATVKGTVFMLRATAWPAASDTVIAQLNNTATTDVDLLVSAAGVLKIRWGSGTVVGPTLSLNTWYKIAFAADDSTTSGVSSLKVDGVAVASPPTHNAIGSLNTFVFGTLAANGGTYHFDNILMFDSKTEVEAHSGSYDVVGGQATSDGTHSITAGHVTDASSTNIVNATTDAYTHVDVPGFESGATTYINWGIGGTDKVAFKFSALPAGHTPQAANFVVFINAGSAASKSFTFELFDGTNTLSLGSKSTGALTRTGGYGYGITSTVAADNAAWSTAKVGTNQLRVYQNGTSLQKLWGVSAEFYTTSSSTTPAPAPGRSSGSSGKSPSSGGSQPVKKPQGNKPNPAPVIRTSSLIFALRRSRHWDIIP